MATNPSDRQPPVPCYSREMVQLLAEAVSNAGSGRVRLRGSSMHPTIPDGETVVVSKSSADELRPGDVVLFQHEGRLVAHRIVALNRPAPGMLLTRGDAVAANDAPVTFDEVIGRVDGVVRDGVVLPLPPPPHTPRPPATFRLRVCLAGVHSQLCGFRWYRRVWRRLCPLGGVVVRDATDEDVPRLAEFMAGYRPRLPAPNRERIVRAELEDARAAGAHYLLAESGPKLLGIGSGGELLKERIGVDGWWIANLHVGTRCRGLGVGTAIVRHLVERAKRDGAAEVLCLVAPGNSASRGLFGKLGFEPAEPVFAASVNAAQAQAAGGAPPSALVLRLPFGDSPPSGGR